MAGLERELAACRAALNDRVAELAVIDSIQQGLVAQLDLASIIDLVGDRLRAVFRSGDLSISWFDEASFVATPIYFYELGKRLVDIQPFQVRRSANNLRMLQTRAGVVTRRVASDVTVVPGTQAPLCYMRAPVVAGERVIAVVNVDNRSNPDAFGDDDVRLLTTVCRAMGMALQSARLFAETQRLLKETEQRNAELAVINSIQQGVSASLELQAVIDLVGNKLIEVFAADVVRIDLLDRERDLVSYPFLVDHGQRFQPPPRMRGLESGISGYAMRTRAVLVFDSKAELLAFFESAGIANSPLGSDVVDESFVYAPLLIDEQPIGLILIGKQPRRAFDPASVKLITTVAASLSLALQNAQSLAAERQRNAELAVITSVQQAVSAELDFQGIVDVVGDKLREVFTTGNLSIWWLEEPGGLTRSLYSYEHGVRDAERSFVPRPGGAADRLLSERQPLLMRSQEEQLAIGFPVMEGTDRARSILAMPMVAGERTWGAVFLENHERDDAFSASQQQLLQTITASMTVALLNARSFEAERRRNAELAVINGIQQGMAATLSFQAIVDLVGNKLREMFGTGDIEIQWLDRGGNLVHRLYVYRRGERLDLAAFEPTWGHPLTQAMQAGRTLIFRNRAEVAAMGFTAETGAEPTLSGVWVPLRVDGELRGQIAIRSHEREDAFDDNAARLLSTVSASMGAALEKRAPVPRDPAPAEGNRAAQRRAGGDQQHPAGRRCRARVPGHRRCRRRQAARSVRHRRHEHPLVGHRLGHGTQPVQLRARRAAAVSRRRARARVAAPPLLLRGSHADRRGLGRAADRPRRAGAGGHRPGAQHDRRAHAGRRANARLGAPREP